MEQSELTCCVCEESYASERLPRVLNCGHSICTPCLELIISLDKKCPECRSRISVAQASSLPVNYSILRLATSSSSVKSKEENSSETHPSSDRCKIHDSVLEFNCRVCNLWLCQKCAAFDHLQPPLGKCKIITACEALEEFKNLHMHKFQRDTIRIEGISERLTKEILTTSSMESETENEMKILQEKLTELQLQQTQNKAKQSEVKALLKMKNQSIELINKVSSVTELLNAIEIMTDCRLKFENFLKDSYEADTLILGDPFKSEAESKQVLWNVLTTGQSAYATFTWKAVPRWSKITLKNGKVHIHALEDGHPPGTELNLPFEELRKLVPKESPTVFLDVGWKGQSRGYVYIRMFEDTLRGRQTTYLCSGERGPSYKNTAFYKYDIENYQQNMTVHILRGGDYEKNNGTGGRAIFKGITNGGKYLHPVTAGLFVSWECNDHYRLGSFYIYLNGQPGLNENTAYGIVTEGLETLKLAAQCKPVSLASVTDCGLVITP